MTESLYDVLFADEKPGELTTVPSNDSVVEVTAKSFCKSIVESAEFRRYILNGIVCGDLPSAVLCKVMDHAWGRPPEHLEHTGANGQPIEITRIERVVVYPKSLTNAIESVPVTH